MSILIIGLKHFFAVVLSRTILSVDRQSILNAVFHTRDQLFQIIYFFITDLLDFRILCGADREAAAVEQIISLSLCVALFIYQIFHNLLDQSIYKIGVRLTARCVGRCLQNTVIYIVSKGFIVLFLGDISLFKHQFQNTFTPACIILRMGDRIVIRRAVCNGCQYGTL